MPNNTGSPPAITVRNLTISYGPRPALLDVSFTVEPGLLVGVIGPNGSGKSTLIKGMVGFIEPDFGEVRIFGQPMDEVRGEVAYVPQRGEVDWDYPITVRQVAMMGRYGHIPWWKDPQPRDHELVDQSLEMVRITDLQHRQIGQLSGGQQQRVFMARALAQGARILLMDEPFAGVDAATERAILDVLEAAKNRGRTLVVVHHDLVTAAEYFDRLVLLNQRMIAYGTPQQVLVPSLLSEVYEGSIRSFEMLAAAEPAGDGRES